MKAKIIKNIKIYSLTALGFIFIATGCSAASNETENVVIATEAAHEGIAATTQEEIITTTETAESTSTTEATTTTQVLTTTTQFTPPVTTPDEIVYVRIAIVIPVSENVYNGGIYKWAPCTEGLFGAIWDDGIPITFYADENGVCRTTRTGPDYEFWIEDGLLASSRDDGTTGYGHAHPDPSLPLFDYHPLTGENALDFVNPLTGVNALDIEKQ